MPTAATRQTRDRVMQILSHYNKAADKSLSFRERFSHWHEHEALMEKYSLQYARLFNIAKAYAYYTISEQPLDVVLEMNTAFLKIQRYDPFGYMKENDFKPIVPLEPISFRKLPKARRINQNANHTGEDQ